MSDANPPFPPPPPPSGGSDFPSPEVPSGFPQPGAGNTPPAGFPQAGFPPQPGFPQAGYAQPGYSQPGYPQAGMPGQPAWGNDAVKKKKAKWPWILLAIFLTTVLLIGGCTAFVFKKFSAITSVGNNFVSALYTSSSAAVANGCPGAFVESDLEQLRADLVNKGWAGGKNLNSTQTSTSNGVSSGVISGTLATNPALRVDLSLGKNGDAWCVNGINVR